MVLDILQFFWIFTVFKSSYAFAPLCVNQKHLRGYILARQCTYIISIIWYVAFLGMGITSIAMFGSDQHWSSYVWGFIASLMEFVIYTIFDYHATDVCKWRLKQQQEEESKQVG